MSRTTALRYVVFLAGGLLIPLQAFGADNLPNFDGYRSLGRLRLFATPKRVQWVLPFAFRSDFTCTGSASAVKRTCYIRVYNALSDGEVVDLRALNEAGRITATLSSIDSMLVTSIDESTPGLPRDFASSTPTTPLAITNGDVPHYSLAARVDANRAEELIRQYRSTGLGSLVAKIILKGELTQGYISLHLSRALVDSLSKAAAVISPAEARRVLRAAITIDELTFSSDFEQATVIPIAVELAKRILFNANAQRNLTVAKGLTTDTTVVLEDDSVGPMTATCTASIGIKADAPQIIECSTSP
jgi:hypothetical protein